MRVTNAITTRAERLLKRKTAGAPPGELLYTGRQEMDKVLIHYTRYGNECLQTTSTHIDEIPALDPPQAGRVDWLDIRGLHREEIIEELGERYGIHPLAMEDILDVRQRPKLEEYPDGIFIIIRAFQFETSRRDLLTEQVSLYLKGNLVISFQEDAGDLFAGVRQRLEGGSGRILKRGADYLTYALIDNVVDHYFKILDQVEDILDQLETQILSNPSPETKGEIHELRLSTLTLRKSLSPMREVASALGSTDHSLISEETQTFSRDLRDHTIQVLDLVETYRDILNGLYDLYVSEISFKMNQVMQTLTVMSVIFIPLSFLVGLYGMNWEYMPELGWRYGYFALWAFMVLLVVGLLWWFRRKHWI